MDIKSTRNKICLEIIHSPFHSLNIKYWSKRCQIFSQHIFKFSILAIVVLFFVQLSILSLTSVRFAVLYNHIYKQNNFLMWSKMPKKVIFKLIRNRKNKFFKAWLMTNNQKTKKLALMVEEIMETIITLLQNEM